MTILKRRLVKPEYEVAFDDILVLMRKHADKMTGLELLAVAAKMLGKLLALQDQRLVSSEAAMQVIAENIQQGNQEAILQLSQTQGSA